MKWDDDELKKQCKNYIKTSLENEKKCNENNIMYFDVSFKFEEIRIGASEIVNIESMELIFNNDVFILLIKVINS